ncbi:Uncharacterised protein [Candidatus Burarchaeum australiense]|nr:Uncharacterised protein [Candidatus Burarchaeum australiense]
MATKPQKSNELIRACPICGNPDLKWVGGGENAAFDVIGETSLSGELFCERCGKKVMPIEFDSEKAYLRFMAETKKAKVGTKAKPKKK